MHIHSAHHRAVYGHFRRAGLQHHDAEDLTQDFWHKMLRLGRNPPGDSNDRLPDFHFNGCPMNPNLTEIDYILDRSGSRRRCFQ